MTEFKPDKANKTDKTEDYKDTIHLPKTDFPMKGNLSEAEPSRIESWKQNRIYEKLLKRNEDRPLFVMPDGPPYANGSLHLGHVLNKVLKDIVIKFRNMSGYQAAFIPGWDCHGLPIELNISKKLGSKRKELSDREIRDLCRQEALMWVEKQKGQFIRLGILADWEHPYLTLQPEYEAEEVRVLAQILENGFLYRGEKPVYWCPALQTALAAAEVEYQEKQSPSIYVKFHLPQGYEKWGISSSETVSFVIWTTTPWTLPANHAICVQEQFDYGFYDTGHEILILATELQEQVSQEIGQNLRLLKTVKGKELEGLKARHPFISRDSVVILGDHVTLDAGTGCVHTAPGHGLEDYQVGLKYGLPISSPVDKAGRFTQEVPQYVGLSIWDGNEKIVSDLKNTNHLLAVKTITHSYPFNPRSKTPLIFRSTPQWFIKLDDDQHSVRKRALEAAENKIQFVPEWGKQRLLAMINNSPDWCLSRQRIWGVPIPIYSCSHCDETLASVQVMKKIADEMETSGEGIEAYHSRPPEFFLGTQTCPRCHHNKWNKSTDILDVWFDSGVCHAAVQRRRNLLQFPADIYLEGSDQHRGWFQTSLISAMASVGHPPFKGLITHGFVTDASGYKMSKSQGNVVDPNEIIKKSGAEILRLWVAYEDYGQDVNVGEAIFQRVTETYRRFRNTLRFMLGNLDDFHWKTHRVERSQMMELDQWALSRLSNLTQRVTEAYNNYEFYKVFHALNVFFTTDLSATYLDVLKDRLYTWKTNGKERRSAQTVLYELTEKSLVLMAPILTFLAEETYSYFPGKSKESILFHEFNSLPMDWHQPELEEKFNVLLDIRNQVQKVLENLRREKIIGSSLDAQVTLIAQGHYLKVLKSYQKDLREFLIVSAVTIKEQKQPSDTDKLHVEARPAEGNKCIRCWHYSKETDSHPQFKGVCPKCVEALT